MRRSLWVIAALLALSGTVTAKSSDPTRLEQDGLKLELAALTPDQVRAFFHARGFPAGDSDHIVATACLFRSAIGSAHTAKSSPEIAVALREWRVTPAGKRPVAPKVREDWESVWKARGVSEDAAIAFYWALFPTEQTFFPNDYNWGFLTFGLAPDTTFDLTVAWSAGGKTFDTTIRGLQCAK